MTAMRREEIYGTRWSAAEDALVRAEYGRRPATEIAARLGRGLEATRQRGRFLGQAQTVKARIDWTAEADAQLRANYRRMPTPELAARLGTTIDAVWARARVLRIVRPGMNTRWTADDDRRLREWYGAVPYVELVARLGRTQDSISNRIQTLGLTREAAVAEREERNQQEIAQLRAELDHLKHGALDAAHAPSTDGRRLAVILAYRLSVIDAATAATVLGVPVARLPVEVGRAAAMGLDVARMALEAT